MGQCCASKMISSQEFVVPESSFKTLVRTTQKMGWKRDLPDFRDKELACVEEKDLKDLPKSKDLRPKEHFEVYDQGNLGSCTANAIGGCFHFAMVQEGKTDFSPSRLFIYYNERAMEGTTDTDSGAQIRDGIKSVVKIGVCSSKDWPYDEAKFTTKPSSKCYTDATKEKATEYARVPQNLNDMKAVLAGGFPYVFGFVVYSSFMSSTVASTGVMPMPTIYDEQMGGHAVMAVGYDDEKQVFIVRNSWGEGWGDKGYFYMPYAYMTDPNLVMDPWVIRFVANKDFLPVKKK